MNRLYATADEARLAECGPVELSGCGSCGFVWNVAFDPGLIVYDEDYENDQTHSNAFAHHMRERARNVIEAVPTAAPVNFLEIGCGQGHFMEIVAEASGERFGSAEGYDPAWRGGDFTPSRIRVHKSYFGNDTVSYMKDVPNVVATRHTIEHVPDPVSFLKTIRHGLGCEAEATIFVETPCVEWILQREAMQDFFYEHCSLFSKKSLEQALLLAGFSRPRVDHVFGGQYLWASARTGASEPCWLDSEPVGFDLDGVQQRFVEKWRKDMFERSQIGDVAIWGAGAKGVNFAYILDPHTKYLTYVIDINPAKQGKHLPGSGLEVLSPQNAVSRPVKTVYVMNPVYLDEIRATMDRLGLHANLVPIN
jgi:hypothetical protein